MKLKYLSVCSFFLLSACNSTAPFMKNSITFVVGPSDFKHKFIFKNNWPLCGNFYDNEGNMPVRRSTKYLTSDNTCKVSPKGYIPEQIVIEYAPWLTYEEQQKIPELKAKQVIITGDRVTPHGIIKDAFLGKDEDAIKYNTTILMENTEKALDKLPPTAWKRIVLTPTKDVKKYKYQTHEGKGNPLRGKEVHYRISLNPDGSHNIETKLYWVQKYSTSWN